MAAKLTATFTIDEAAVAPTWDNAWLVAPGWVKVRFFEALVQVVLSEKDAELDAGLDRHGRKLQPLKLSTILHRHSAMGRADPLAPPLMPAHAMSRTRAWLTGKVEGDPDSGYRAVFGWRQQWGTILGYHARGAGHLPVRDVIGLAPATMARIKARALNWWVMNKNLLLSGVYIPKEVAAAVPKRGAEARNVVIGGKTYTFGISTGTAEGGAFSAAEAYMEALARGKTSGRGFRRHIAR